MKDVYNILSSIKASPETSSSGKHVRNNMTESVVLILEHGGTWVGVDS